MERRPSGAGCRGRRGEPCVAQLSWGIWPQGRGPGRPCGGSAAPHWARLWVLLLAGVPSPQSHRPRSPQAGQWVWRLRAACRDLCPSQASCSPWSPQSAWCVPVRQGLGWQSIFWRRRRALGGSSTGGRSRCLCPRAVQSWLTQLLGCSPWAGWSHLGCADSPVLCSGQGDCPRDSALVTETRGVGLLVLFRIPQRPGAGAGLRWAPLHSSRWTGAQAPKKLIGGAQVAPPRNGPRLSQESGPPGTSGVGLWCPSLLLQQLAARRLREQLWKGPQPPGRRLPALTLLLSLHAALGGQSENEEREGLLCPGDRLGGQAEAWGG